MFNGCGPSALQDEEFCGRMARMVVEQYDGFNALKLLFKNEQTGKI